MDSLFQLVHSLSKSEKRYFRLFARRHALGGENHYLALLHWVTGQPKAGLRRTLRIL